MNEPGVDAAPKPTFGEFVRAWVSISLQTFGGPAAQISVMHRALVEERRWLSEHRYLRALSYCTLLPGPEAQQLAIYCGWLMCGTAGGIVAGSLFVLPGFVVLLAVSLIYVGYGDTAVVAALFAGVAPAVLPIVLQAVTRVARRALGNLVRWGLAIGAFLALFALDVPFPVVIGAALVLGLTAGRRWPAAFSTPGASPGEAESEPVDLAANGHARAGGGRFARVLVVGLSLWALPFVLIATTVGTDSTLFDQARFFSITAVVTFGGAYAVLGYIGQRAVDVYGWLRPGEMATALALAETTPGPLIQLVQFVGFIGAYRSPGTLDPWVAGILASVVVTWVTYVPCFLWIFLGAPSVERLHERPSLTHALNAVMAAVVGVIANLAAYFAVHTLFERVEDGHRFGPLQLIVPEWSSLDVRALAIAVGAAIVLFRFRWSVPRVVVVAAVVGGVLYL